MLIAIIETVPLKDYVDSLVSKLLKTVLWVPKSRDPSVGVELGQSLVMIADYFWMKIFLIGYLGL